MFKQCKYKLLLIVLIFTCNLTYGQELQRINFEDIKYRNVGPTRGGRSTSVSGVITNEFTFYMRTSGGGFWKTIDRGQSWNNISDGYFESASIGSIDVFQSNPDIIYVGTGSDGIRSNVIVGKGAYKSLDAGKSWEFIGLKSAGQIGAIKVHPENPDIVYAAAIGQPFKQNTERGLFKSIDGGKNWKKILYISDKIGICLLYTSPSPRDS